MASLSMLSDVMLVADDAGHFTSMKEPNTYEAELKNIEVGLLVYFVLISNFAHILTLMNLMNCAR